MVRIRGEVKVVDHDVAALANVFEGNGAADSSGAASYCGSFGEEEIVWHFGLGLGELGSTGEF